MLRGVLGNALQPRVQEFRLREEMFMLLLCILEPPLRIDDLLAENQFVGLELACLKG